MRNVTPTTSSGSLPNGIVRVRVRKTTLSGVGVLDLDPSVGSAATLSQLQEDTDFLIKYGEWRLFKRPNRADQTNQGYAAWSFWIDLHVLADDQIPNYWIH
jgi:hypothetical protein